MKRLLTIIGARPQIIKAAALNRAIRHHFSDELTEILVHTGQHYDHGMSDVFFEEMNIPKPDHQLNIGSGSHGAQTGKMLEAIEQVILSEKPDALVIYGDTNSTLAGALAAVKLHVPVVHIEAGLRSFNKRMPEEVNRITADHASTLLFSPTKAGIENLRKEGISTLDAAQTKGPADLDNPYVFHSGDLMYDNTLHYGGVAESKADVFEKFDIDRSNFLLATIHRPQNTDNLEILIGILSALNAISVDDSVEVVLPLHPRTANILAKSTDSRLKKVRDNDRFKLIDPVGFLEMILFEKSAKMVLTDSGGVQKEAFFMQKPCIILRPETEWIEIVEHGCGVLVGPDAVKIRAAYEHLKNTTGLNFPPIFGDGHAAEFICQTMVKELR